MLHDQFKESKEQQRQIIQDIAQVQQKLSEQAEEISLKRERENVELKEKLDQLLGAQTQTDERLVMLTAKLNRMDKDRDFRIAPATTGHMPPPCTIDFNEVSDRSNGGDSSIISSLDQPPTINHRPNPRRPLSLMSDSRQSHLPRPSSSAHRRLSTKLPSQPTLDLDEENLSPLKNVMRQTPKKQGMSKKNDQMMNKAKEVRKSSRLNAKKAKAHWPEATDHCGGRLTRSRRVV